MNWILPLISLVLVLLTRRHYRDHITALKLMDRRSYYRIKFLEHELRKVTKDK